MAPRHYIGNVDGAGMCRIAVRCKNAVHSVALGVRLADAAFATSVYGSEQQD
jgi:hypothetical protein